MKAGLLESFLPRDRRSAIAEGRAMPDRVRGAGLFADISGFTPLTEALVAAFGPQRGAEELDANLNRVYEAIVGNLFAHDGEVIYFSGDAITCWLDGDDGSRAVRCGLDMQQTLRSIGQVQTPQGSVTLSIKVVVVSGEARRIVVGDPDVQLLDVLGGGLVDRLAATEGLSAAGEVVADQSVLDALGDRVVCTELRDEPVAGRRCGVVVDLLDPPAAALEPPMAATLTPEQVRPWLWRFVYDRLTSGGGVFLGELRTVHPIFVRFGGFDFDGDPDVATGVDEFVRAVQEVLSRYDGTLLGITVGDKGAYLNAVMGTPRSHEDDARRAVAAAIEIRDLESTTAATDLQVGVSVGRIYAGTYGHSDRRTLSVLGDATNVAARLMSKAPAGEVYVLAEVAAACEDHVVWTDLPPLVLKGKAQPVHAREAVLLRPRRVRRVLRYPLPIVGRDRELDVVREHIRAVVSGERRVLGVGADAGMGKSRFVAEVLREASGARLPFAYGQADLLGRTTSYLTWREPFRVLLGLDDDRDDDEQVRDLERVLRSVNPTLTGRLPLLGAVVGLDIPDNDLAAALDAKLRKTSLENLLADVLAWRLGVGPLLVVLEDLHWIDPPSIDLLEALIRRTDGLPILFLLSYRLAAHGAPAALAKLPTFTEIVLADLDHAGMRQVVATKVDQVFGTGVSVSDALVELVLDRAQGNPFYAEELVNYVRRLGIDPADAVAVDAIDLPDSLQAIVLSRIDGLDEHPRQGVKVASVIGREFDAEMIGQVHTPLGERDAALAHLGAARAADLVVPAEEDLVRWLFRHAITRDVAYESIPFAVRSPMHERVGDLIVRDDEGPHTLDLIAHHYWHSDSIEKKRRYLRLAGDAARDAYANDAAIEHYRRLASIVDGSARADALRDLAGVLELVGDWDGAHSRIGEARSLAVGEDDEVQVGWCDVSLAEIARKRGRYDEAAELLQGARRAFLAQGEEAGEARVLHLRGTIAAQQGDLVEARRAYEASRAIRERIGDVPGLASLLSNLGIVAEYEGDFVASRTFHEDALELRRSTGDRWAIANSHTNLGMIAVHEERYAEARSLFEEAMRLNTEIGDTWSVALGHNNLGNASRGLGDRAAARGHYAQALQVYRDYDDRWALAFLLEDVAQLAAAEDPRTALELLGGADRMRDEIDAPRPESLVAELTARLTSHIAGLSTDEQERARAAGRALPAAKAIERAAAVCAPRDA